MANNSLMHGAVAQDAESPTMPGESETTVDDPILALETVTKEFSEETAVDGISLDVERGELLTLLGPSGCGKTTTLRLVAGLETPTGGEIRLNDDRVATADGATDPEDRDVGIVFQDFALFPHLSVRDNIAFGLEDMDDVDVEARVDELLELVNMPGHGEKSPDQLSGGQKQRVALARSLAPEPEVLLLDEPFSNRDVDLRVKMREEVRRILKETGVTAISVTHDQEEAMSISDRVAVMNDGRIEQVGDPEQVFQQPESRFVAGFLGHASFLPGYVHGDEVTTGLGPVSREQINGLAGTYDRTRIDVLVRPDDIRAVPVEGEADGRVVSRRYLGPTILYEVRLDDDTAVQCMHNHDESIPLDETVRIELDADHELAWFPTDQRPLDADE